MPWRGRDGDVLAGLFTRFAPARPGGRPRYYNSVVSVGVARPQLYRKRHLVPFGETIPLEPVVGWFIRKVLSIPIASQASRRPGSAGARSRRPARGRRTSATRMRSAPRFACRRADATLLVNVTNDAWYARSLAALQHNQIAAMRALETGRPLLRATNTGITSAIAHDGREIARLPWFTRGILEVEITGRQGVTPYVRFGDALPVLRCFDPASSSRSHSAGARRERSVESHFPPAAQVAAAYAGKMRRCAIAATLRCSPSNRSS